QDMVAATKNKERSGLTEVEDLNTRISARENLIKVTNQQANELTKNININIQKIDQLRKELDLQKKEYASLILKSQKSSSEQSRMMFLLSSENFLQAYKRIQYMQQFADYRKKTAQELEKKALELQELNKSLAEQQKEKQKLIDENKIDRNQLQEEKKHQEALMATPKKDEKKYVTQGKQKRTKSTTRRQKRSGSPDGYTQKRRKKIRCSSKTKTR